MKKTNHAAAPATIATITLIAALCISGMGRIVTTTSGQASANNANAKTVPSYPALSTYALDLTALARQTTLEATASNADMRLILRALTEDTTRNPVIIANSGEIDVNGIARAWRLES